MSKVLDWEMRKLSRNKSEVFNETMLHRKDLYNLRSSVCELVITSHFLSSPNELINVRYN